MSDVAKDSEDIYYNHLFKISSYLLNADRDFYQSYTAALNHYYLKAASLEQLNSNMESVVEQANDLKSIAEALQANVEYFKVRE